MDNLSFSLNTRPNEVFTTVGIIVKNEELHIRSTLTAILGMDYPAQLFEVLVVDGRSSDRTMEIIQEIAASDSRVRCLVEPWVKGTHGMARNLLADNARGALLAFTDGDCIVRSDWLSILVSSLLEARTTDARVVAAGGRRVPAPSENWKENVLNAVMTTYLGSGGSQGFVATSRKYTDSIPNYNAIYITNVVRKLRYSDLGVGEDFEFNLRLRKNGGRILFCPATVQHHQEGQFHKFCLQMFRYGDAQAKIFKRMGVARYFALVSALFVVGLIVGGVLSFFSWIIAIVYLSVLGVYVGLCLMFAIVVTLRMKALIGMISALVYPVQHVSYGLGVIVGIFSRRPLPARPQAAD